MKDNDGHSGNHCNLVETEEQYSEILDKDDNISFIFQEFIKNASGVDYRLFIIGGKYTCCLKRDNSGKDFRSNIAQGGKEKNTKVSKSLCKQAEELCKKAGLTTCTVDFLNDNGKFLFCEMNSSPGWGTAIRLGHNLYAALAEAAYNMIKNKSC